MATLFFSCAKTEHNPRLKTGPDKKWLAMKEERERYIRLTRSMKTEYEVARYINEHTQFLRKTMLQEFGSEEGWQRQLQWLEKHGGKIVGYFDNGGPIYDRKPFSSPYERGTVENTGSQQARP